MPDGHATTRRSRLLVLLIYSSQNTNTQYSGGGGEAHHLASLPLRGTSAGPRRRTTDCRQRSKKSRRERLENGITRMCDECREKKKTRPTATLRHGPASRRTVKPKFHGSSFLVASSTSRGRRACRGTFPFSLPSAYLIDRPARFACLLYTSPSPRDRQKARMPSSA